MPPAKKPEQPETNVATLEPIEVPKLEPQIHAVDLARLLGDDTTPMVDEITPSLKAAYHREQRKYHQYASGPLPLAMLVQIVAEVTGQRIILPKYGRAAQDDDAADIIPRTGN